jgi:hypothetical protein
MPAVVRVVSPLFVLIAVAGIAQADPALSTHPEIVKRVKAATVFVQLGNNTGAAFCVHPSGLFVTCAVAEGIELVIDAGLPSQRTVKPRVIRRDQTLGLTLLQADSGPAPFVVLPIGDDLGLAERQTLLVAGVPVGGVVQADGKFPPVEVSKGKVTGPARDKNAEPRKFAFTTEFQMEMDGAPILDGSGMVVGLVNALSNQNVNEAIPARQIKTFLARPEITLSPSVVARTMVNQPIEFRAEVFALLPETAPDELELLVGPSRNPRRFAMQRAEAGFHVKCVAFAPYLEHPDLPVNVDYAYGFVRGKVKDREIQVGTEAIKLSQVERLVPGERAEAILWGGRKIAGKLDSLESLAVEVGPKPLSLNATLEGARELIFRVPESPPAVSCTVVSRQAGKETGSICLPLYLEGAEQAGLDAIRDGLFFRPIHAGLPVTYFRAAPHGFDGVSMPKLYIYISIGRYVISIDAKPLLYQNKSTYIHLFT